MRPAQRRGGTQLGLGVIMLASQLLNVGLDRIPPVTLVTIAGQVALFLNILKPPWHRYDACISVYTVLQRGDYRRLLISTVEHADEWHLYYNMVSFLWKGMRLERRMGSRKFGILLAVFSVACSATYLGLASLLTSVLEDAAYSRQCAIGFSGVIFALKVLTHQLEAAPGQVSYLHGLAVPARWAVWAELVLIHILVPGASFIGHLAGILVGLAYTLGPLEVLIDVIDKMFGVPLSRTQRPTAGDGASHTYTYHSGPSGRREASWHEQSAGGAFSDLHGGGAARTSNGGSPPPFGWNVPPSAPPPDPAAGWRRADAEAEVDADLAEALRRSRETYAEERAHRRRYGPSAPPPPPQHDW